MQPDQLPPPGRGRSRPLLVGSLQITFADYSIAPPQSMMVLSVADTGTLELQLHFTRG